MSQLGTLLAAQGNRTEAEPLLTGGYEGMKIRETKIPAHRKKDLEAAGSRIVSFYEGWAKPEKALAWQQKLAAAGDPEKP